MPFHASPLLNGHDDYEGMELADRKRLLSAFRVFFRHMPVRYTCVALKTKEYPATDEVSNTMRRRLVEFLFDELPYFQGFDVAKIYYGCGMCVRDCMQQCLAMGADGMPAQARLPQRLRRLRGVPALHGCVPHRGAVVLVAFVSRTNVNPSCRTVDPIIALSYAELYAESMGLGCVWCEIATSAVRQFPTVQRLVEMPAGYDVGYAMPLGEPAVRYRRAVLKDWEVARIIN